MATAQCRAISASSCFEKPFIGAIIINFRWDSHALACQSSQSACSEQPLPNWDRYKTSWIYFSPIEGSISHALQGLAEGNCSKSSKEAGELLEACRKEVTRLNNHIAAAGETWWEQSPFPFRTFAWRHHYFKCSDYVFKLHYVVGGYCSEQFLPLQFDEVIEFRRSHVSSLMWKYRRKMSTRGWSLYGFQKW